MKPQSITDKVYNYPTKYKQGFIASEIKELLKEYPNINMDKFYDALSGNTCMIIDKEVIRYHCDIEKALNCGIEGRDITFAEFD